MNINLSSQASLRLRTLPMSDREAIFQVLHRLDAAKSWHALIAAEGSDLRKLSFSDADAGTVAYREYRTPLFSHRVGSYRLILTLTGAGDARDQGQTILIVDIIAQSALRAGRSSSVGTTATNFASEPFIARVQYGDWRGECSADDGDFTSFGELLRERQLIHEGEFLIGLSFYNGENLRGQPVSPIYARALVILARDYETAKAYIDTHDPIRVREVRIELSAEETLRCFKRFSIAITRRGFNLIGQEITTD